jgi:hypothetical protein
MTSQLRRRLAIVAATLLLALAAVTAPSASAQDDDGYSLSVTAANCDTPPDWPFLNGGCEVAEVYIEVTDVDDNLLDSCTTSGVEDGRAGGCVMIVSFSTTVVVWLDESTIPTGYVLSSENPQTFDTPAAEPDGEDIGPIFINLLEGGMAPPQDTDGEVVQLPDTGSGPVAPSPAATSTLWLALVGLIMGSAFVIRPRTAS